ncbi:MAG: hypothetical protein COT36_04705 [Parcubacteria group bacterium CG08_land_8_20_14_0_20_38_56]|nr:MAG: hypothetical protein COT36_04705 [Parcubacteria group bacterium CG08_land_8_20_14_0_20_38_56]
MPLHYHSPIYFLHYFLKREASQFFVSIAIRNLALGMVLIFEPIYIYLHFGSSLPLTLLYFGIIHGLFGLMAFFFGGKIMAKVGLKHCMLLSHPFFLGNYICLFFLPNFSWLIFFAIISRFLGMFFFWPAFHTDFVHFSEKEHRGRGVGGLNIAFIAPSVISPIIGGWILATSGYSALFISVLCVLLASALPLFLSRDTHQVFTDSYQKTWKRIFKKENQKITLALMAASFEGGIQIYLWPLFMFILAISYESMGGIISFAVAVSALFTLYMGRITDRINHQKLLNTGSFLTSIAWVFKYFVVTPFEAFLVHSLYRIFQSAAGIPFQTIFYDKTAEKGQELDEFIIYRETVINLSRCFLFLIFAGLFSLTSKLNIAFIMAAIFSLGFMFLGEPPWSKFKWRKKQKK